MNIKNTLKKCKAEFKRRATIKGNERARLLRCYYKTMQTKPIQDKMVMFEAYQASRMSCNPLAIFEWMKKQIEFEDFIYVWVLSDADNYYAKQYEGNPHFIVVAPHSIEFVKYLAVAKYLVNNKTFPYYFVKREGQVHISTWHGIPLKTLGKQQLGSMGQYNNVARNYIHTDYLVMPDRFTANIMLECTDMQSLFQGYVIDAGYPRVDFTLNTDYNEMRQFLAKLLNIDISKKLVLYAPTWRGEVGNAKDTTDVILDNLLALSEGLPKEYELLLKIHDRTYVYVKDNPRLQQMKNIPDFIDTNKLLAAMDVLITDYSSIYFEFMCLKRPILFFVYDREEYESTRGLYFSLDTQVPGPLCYTAAEVNECLSHIDEVSAEYKTVYDQIFQDFCYNDDGHATDRVMNIIFHQKDMEYAYKIESKKKIKTLMYLGNLSKNSISESVIAQINQLDSNQYDLYLLCAQKPSQKNERYLKLLADHVRVIYRVPMPVSKERDYYIANCYEKENGYGRKFVDVKAAQRYRYHYLSNQEFDLCIDFTGTPSIWNLIFAKTAFRKKVVFMNQKYSKQLIRIQYAKKYFDEVICTRRKDYESYASTFATMEGEGDLKFLPVPASMENYLKNLKKDLTNSLSYADQVLSAAAVGKKNASYVEDCKTSQDKSMEKADQLIQIFRETGKVDEAFLTDYRKAEKEFHSIFVMSSDKIGGSCE